MTKRVDVIDNSEIPVSEEVTVVVKEQSPGLATKVWEFARDNKTLHCFTAHAVSGAVTGAIAGAFGPLGPVVAAGGYFMGGVTATFTQTYLMSDAVDEAYDNGIKRGKLEAAADTAGDLEELRESIRELKKAQVKTEPKPTTGKKGAHS